MTDMNGKETLVQGSDIWRGALAIFSFLLVIYLLSFSGQFTSVDELALYAKTESLVQDGSLETPQLAFAAYHNPVGDIEPGLPIIASPLYWFAQQSHHLNNIQTVMLLTPLVTAATAGVLFAISRLIGYSGAGSAFAALTFGLSTLAWPYARTLYREPLVGLVWTLGLLGMVLWRYRGQRKWAIVGGIALVLALAVKVTAITAIPFIFIAALAGYHKRYKVSRYLLILGGVVAVVIILSQVVFSWRFGSAWDLRTLSDWSMEIGIRRVYGQLLSPGKGLLVYMPVVLLTIPGLVLMWRRHRAVALAIALPLLSTAVAYSNYGSWFGGQSWGPRFLVPAISLLGLSLAPLWDETRNRWLRALYVGLVGLSIVIQLGVVTANWWPGYKALYDSGPNPEETSGLQLANIDISPPIVQLREWSPENLDLLWLHPDREGSFKFSAVPLSLLLLALLATIVAWFMVRRWQAHPAWLLLPSLLAIVILLAFGPAATPGYTGLPADQGRELAAWSEGVDSESYTLVTMSNEFHIYYYLGFLKGDFTHHWYSPDQITDFEPILELSKGSRLSLVLDRVHKDPTFSGKDLEWWLNEQLYRAESEWIGDYEVVHYANIPSDDWKWIEVNDQFGESFLINRYAINREQFRAGDTIGLQLDICRAGPMPGYHHLFTHLVSGAAQVNGYDGPLRYGGVVILPWEEGDCLVERRSFTIPQETPLGQYDLIVGFDTPDGLLSVKDKSGQTADFAVFQQVDIVP
jgi:hypothetical protein